jgi:putative IMPACT (imprinted ancient) family translation regulator
VSFRLRVDGASVAAAGAAVRQVGAQLDGAPAGTALRAIAAALPGGDLARAAAEEADEWAGEMAELGALFERYSTQLQRAVDDHRRTDAEAAGGLRGAR